MWLWFLILLSCVVGCVVVLLLKVWFCDGGIWGGGDWLRNRGVRGVFSGVVFMFSVDWYDLFFVLNEVGFDYRDRS